MGRSKDQKSLPQGGSVQAQGACRACPWCSILCCAVEARGGRATHDLATFVAESEDGASSASWRGQSLNRDVCIDLDEDLVPCAYWTGFACTRPRNSCACRLASLDATRDAQLLRVGSYIGSSLGDCLVRWVSMEAGGDGVGLFTDADLVGCSRTQRSTTGPFFEFWGA